MIDNNSDTLSAHLYTMNVYLKMIKTISQNKKMIKTISETNKSHHITPNTDSAFDLLQNEGIDCTKTLVPMFYSKNGHAIRHSKG
jgi:hypothetical protein